MMMVNRSNVYIFKTETDYILLSALTKLGSYKERLHQIVYFDQQKRVAVRCDSDKGIS